MKDERQHSLLSPSSANRWLRCTPSARATEHYPDFESRYALEGTLAHVISEAKLKYRLGLAREPPQCGENKEMDVHTDGYVNFVLAQLNGLQNPRIYVEVKVDCSTYIPECSGTTDAVIISDGVLKIVDFKYGAGAFIEATDNNQLKIYSLGILSMFDFLYEIDTVSLSIYQPRLQNISTWEISRESLVKWGEDTLRPIAKLAWEGKGELSAGEHCWFCRAKNECGAYRQNKLKEAIYDFSS